MVQVVEEYRQTKRQKLEALRAQLETERQSHVQHWRDLSDYVLPWRSRFLVSNTNRGERRSGKIIDSSGTYAVGVLSAGMMSGTTNPAQKWFRLTTTDQALVEVDSVRMWLHLVTERMITWLLRSNIYDSFPVMYEDAATFGTSPMLIDDDPEGTMHTTVFSIGSYLIANDAMGRVRVFMRTFRMTVRQIVEEFAEPLGRGRYDMSNISAAVQQLYRAGQLEAWVDVVHAIVPNEEYREGALESKYKRYYSCYYELGTGSAAAGGGYAQASGVMLRESGYDYFPVLCMRWSLKDGDVYGTNCPAMTALGDIRQLQTMEKRAAQAIEKMVNPSMVAPPELESIGVTILPGGVNYIADPEGKRLRPAHEVRFSLAELEAKEAQIRERIYNAFYVNIILMMEASDRRSITATEIEERRREKMLALGRVLQRFDRDVLNPLIDIVFAMMQERGEIPEPPEELLGVELKVEYLSTMAQAQKLSGISLLERFAGFVGQLAAANPEVLDKIDLDQIVDEYAEWTGQPPRIVRSDEKVAEIRALRAQQMRQAELAQMAKSATGAVKDLAGVRMDEDTAMTRLLRIASPMAQVEAAA